MKVSSASDDLLILTFGKSLSFLGPPINIFYKDKNKAFGSESIKKPIKTIFYSTIWAKVLKLVNAQQVDATIIKIDSLIYPSNAITGIALQEFFLYLFLIR